MPVVLASNPKPVFNTMRLVVLPLVCTSLCIAAQTLIPTYSGTGLSGLSYNDGAGHTTAVVSSENYSIGKQSIVAVSDGHLISGYGDSECGSRTWNGTTHTKMSTCPNGITQTTQYVSDGVSKLDIIHTIVNPSGSGAIVKGVSVLPLRLDFPSTPNVIGVKNSPFAMGTFPLMNKVPSNHPKWNGDWGTGMVMPVSTEPTKPLYYGFESAGSSTSQNIIMATLKPDGLAGFDTPFNRTVNPGETDTFTVSLRFGPSGSSLNSLAHDAYLAWATAHPQHPNVGNMNHGSIQTVYLSDATSGTVSNVSGGIQAARSNCGANNPNNYHLFGAFGFSGCGTSVYSSAFRQAVLYTSYSAVQSCNTATNCKYIITWDIEGQGWPQDVSYVCAPAEIATIAPEMEQTITSGDLSALTAGGVNLGLVPGMKLDDAYFAIQRNAGKIPGGCIRPQLMTVDGSGNGTRTWVSDAAQVTHLDAEMSYAHSHWAWGAAYVDTAVEGPPGTDADGGDMPPSTWESVSNDNPYAIWMPEEYVPADFAFTAPFSNFQYSNDLGTPAQDPDIYAVYPNAKRVNMINNAGSGAVSSATSALTTSVQKGDNLMTNGFNVPAINSIYATLPNCSGGSPCPTNVAVNSVSHSSVQITFQTNAGFSQADIRYVDKTANPAAVCGDGTSGLVQSSFYSSGQNYNGISSIDVAGLTPAHAYSFCPEVNGSFNGTKSSGGPSISVTLPSQPAIHPAPPIPPTTFDTSYPDTTGFTTLTMGTDCANFGACLTTAINNQLAHGTIISIPAGVDASTIGGVGSFGGEGFFPVSPDVVNFSNSDVNAISNTISHTAHGFSEGNQAVFGVSYGCLPGNYPANTSGCQSGANNNPIPFGVNIPYFVHVLDANTFQLYTCPGPDNGTAPACSFVDGTLLRFADQGGGTMRYAKYPRTALHWIVARTSTPTSQFLPFGTRLQGPPDTYGVPTRPTQWLPKMANLQVGLYTGALINIGDFNTNPMNAKIWLEGLHFSYTDTNEASLSGDPFPGSPFLVTNPDVSNIVVSHCYGDAPESPFRSAITYNWDGLNMGWLGNYWTGLQGWHQTMSGLGFSSSGSTFTIASGSTAFASVTASLTTSATITMSGSQSTQQRTFVYFTPAGQLNVVPPYGITATVSGPTNVHIVNTSGLIGSGPALLANPSGSSATFPGSGGGINNYYVDPILSASSSCTATYTLLPTSITTTPPPFAAVTGGADRGLRFYSDAAQYLCGVRFWKNAGDTGTHTATAWSNTGTQLATATYSGESSSGWQSVLFSSPPAISGAATPYVVSTHSASGWVYGLGQFQNMDLYIGNAHLVGAYVSSNGTSDYNDAWPRDYLGRPAAGIVGYADVSTSGTIAGTGNSDIGTKINASFGNGIVCGRGPGPLMAIGNFVSGAGLPWHCDNGGLRGRARGDYTFIRNYHYMPRYAMFTLPTSDRMDYTHRQLLEWKGGNRARVYGSILDGSIKEGGSIAMIALQSPGEVNCITDADVMYNTFEHGPGTLGGGIEGLPETCPPVRTRFAQNLDWDINGNYTTGSGGTQNYGYFVSGGIGIEDVIVDHNTDVGRGGNRPLWWENAAYNTEGVQITNNILMTGPGINEDDSGISPTPACGSYFVNAKASFDCHFTPSYTMAKNVLLPSFGASQSTIQGYWPTLPNYIPSSGVASAQGYFSVPGTFGLTAKDPDLHLKSVWCSGCGSPGTDGKDVGADVDLVLAQQGHVTFNGVTGITTSSAQVNFVAPDAAGCRVDISTSDPNVVNGFTPFTDAGGGTNRGGNVRNVALTGLASGTTYYGRVDCMVEQPYFRFKTR